MVDDICKNVCNVLKSHSDTVLQQKKDILQEIKDGHCSQAIINKSINLDGMSDKIADIVIGLDKKNICKCGF